jgi:hypothetical protein
MRAKLKRYDDDDDDDDNDVLNNSFMYSVAQMLTFLPLHR